MWKIDVGGGDPTNPIPVHAGIVPIHKNHADTGIVLILENCINVETVHVRASMLTEVWIPQRSDSLTRLLWML